jgi:hypothetical protein
LITFLCYVDMMLVSYLYAVKNKGLSGFHIANRHIYSYHVTVNDNNDSSRPSFFAFISNCQVIFLFSPRVTYGKREVEEEKAERQQQQESTFLASILLSFSIFFLLLFCNFSAIRETIDVIYSGGYISSTFKFFFSKTFFYY